MTATLKPYPAYKDSGVPWLGDVPAHWEVRRQRTVTKMLVSNVDKHTHEGEVPVRLCNYVDVYKHNIITDRLPFMRATASQEEIDHFRLQIGDVLITKDSEMWDDIGVPTLVAYESPDLVCGYHLAILRPRKDVICGDFLLWALQSQGVASQHYILANGITRFGLSQDAIKSVWLPIPPLAEQRAIAAFLDHHDRLTRRYIHAQQRLIKLLTEQKQALIQQAVTRGLDPDVPLKDSGIEWVGKIPAHWNVLMNHRIFREEIRPYDGSPEIQLSLSQRDGLIPTKDMQERSLQTSTYDNWKVTLPGDLVLNRFKAHLGVFFCATLRGIVTFHYGVFCPRIELVTKYFELLFHTKPYRTIFAGRSNGMTVGLQNLSNQNFYGVRVIMPPISEQRAIVDFVEKQTAQLESAIAAARRQIALVREYRTRLIADVVTGKLDVRDVALPTDATPDTLEEIDADFDDEAADTDALDTQEDADADNEYHGYQ